MAEAEKKAEAAKARVNPKEIAIVAVILLVLAGGVFTGYSKFNAERERQTSGLVLGPEEITDGISIEAVIVASDPAKNEMTVRLLPTAVGSYLDDGNLAKPVSMFVESDNGIKQTDFKVKTPLPPQDVVIGMYGDAVTSYPLDAYVANISIQLLDVDEEATKAEKATTATTFTGPTPSNVVMFGSLHGFALETVAGSEEANEPLEANIALERSASTKFFAVFVMAVMWGLTLSVVFLGLSVFLRGRKVELPLISMMGVVLFAMPALRNTQPAVPPIGVLSDYLSFFWCEVVAAITMVSMIFTFLRRKPA